MVDIAVVGAGTMGAGITENAALAGLSVVMVDIKQDALDRGRETIERDLRRRVTKERLSEDESRGCSAVSRRLLGPFEWVEEIGASSIVGKLDSLRMTLGEAYIAAPALREAVL